MAAEGEGVSALGRDPWADRDCEYMKPKQAECPSAQHTLRLIYTFFIIIMYTYMYIYMYMYNIHIHTYIYICVCVYMKIDRCVCIYVCIDLWSSSSASCHRSEFQVQGLHLSLCRRLPQRDENSGCIPFVHGYRVRGFRAVGF